MTSRRKATSHANTRSTFPRRRIPTQGLSVLRAWPDAVLLVRGDHRDPTFPELGVERIAVIRLVPDHAFGETMREPAREELGNALAE